MQIGKAVLSNHCGFYLMVMTTHADGQYLTLEV